MVVVDGCFDDVSMDLFLGFLYGFIVDDLWCVVAGGFRVFGLQCVFHVSLLWWLVMNFVARVFRV